MWHGGFKDNGNGAVNSIVWLYSSYFSVFVENQVDISSVKNRLAQQRKGATLKEGPA